MRERDWAARDSIALLLIVTMTSSGCSGGCRRQAPAPAAAGERGAGSTAAASSPATGAAAARVAVPALDAAATTESLAFVERVAGQPANAPPDIARQAAALGRDAGKVFAFVRNEIRYQVYDGVLRGAAGALSGRAANAWDTALLTAGLLRHAGFDVRFARGTLPESSARALIDRMFDQAMQPARQALGTGGLQPPAAAVDAADALRARIDANWATNTAEVMAALKTAGITLGTEPPVSDAALLAEARDHVWVEYRDGIQWTPLDPLAADRPGEAVTGARETFSEMPESRQHVVTITLNVEQRAGGAIETKSALTLRAPAAELHGQPIVLAYQLDIVGSGGWKAMPALVVGDKAVGGTAYGITGIQTAEQAATGGIGGRLNQMFGAAPAAVAELTAVWLDVTMSSPDGRSETVRREVLDRIGPVARADHAESTAPLQPLSLADSRPVAFSGVMACAVTAGPLDAATLTARIAEAAALLRDEGLRSQLAKGDAKGLSDSRLRQVGMAAGGMLTALPQSAHLLSQQGASEAAPALRQAIVFYESSPRVAIATFSRAAGADQATGSTVSLDLRRNALRAVGRGVAPAEVIAANIARGVLDGAIEDALVASDVPAASSVSLLADARAKSIAITASSPSTAATTGWSEHARARIRADDAPSVAVVAPENPVAFGGASRAGWWRIDVATGETIGVLDSGLHGAADPEAAFIHSMLWAYFVCGQVMYLGVVVGSAGGAVSRAAMAFIRAAAPDAASGGHKGWEAAKKSW